MVPCVSCDVYIMSEVMGTPLVAQTVPISNGLYRS
jgi:hypothetical protein